MASSVLWPGLTSAGSATPCDVGYSCGEFTPLVGSVSRRPPRGRTTTFVPCSCRIYCRELRVALDFLVSGRVIRSIQPPMRFLFVSSELCLRLLSDSTSRRTPLPLAVTFPLSGRFGDFHPLERVRAGRTTYTGFPRPCRKPVFFLRSASAERRISLDIKGLFRSLFFLDE